MAELEHEAKMKLLNDSLQYAKEEHEAKMEIFNILKSKVQKENVSPAASQSFLQMLNM